MTQPLSQRRQVTMMIQKGVHKRVRRWWRTIAALLGITGGL